MKMLRLFLQGIEQILGPALSTLSPMVYWVGLAFLLLAAVTPLCKQVIELGARKVSLERHWVMTCSHCRSTTMVLSKHCGYCGEVLDLPLYIRLWSHIPTTVPSWQFNNVRWVLHTLAATFFIAGAAVLVVASGGIQPTGDLHQLFLGLSFFALGAFGWFAGQSLSLHAKGLLARVRDGLVACCSIAALIIFLFLGSHAQPIEEAVLAQFSTEPDTAMIGDYQLHLPTGQIGFEYLQVDHETLGIHHIVPLAFLGDDRLTIPHGKIQTALIQHLKTHPDRYGSRGITIRVRIDQHQTTPGETYDIVERDGQVLVRKTSGPLFIPDEENS